MLIDYNKPRRKAIRLKGYDYSRNGLYYVTICTKDRKCLFGEIKDGKMQKNEYGEILESVWNMQPSEPGMQPTKHGLTEIVRALKTFSARKINELRQTQGTPVWQRNYYEHIIRNDDDYYRTVNYIKGNPARWNGDDNNCVVM